MKVKVWDPVDAGHHRRYLEALAAHVPPSVQVKWPEWFRDGGQIGEPDVVLAMDANELPRRLLVTPEIVTPHVIFDLRGILGSLVRPERYHGRSIRDRVAPRGERLIREALVRRGSHRFVYLNEWASRAGSRLLRVRSSAVGDSLEPVGNRARDQGARERVELALLGVMTPRKGLDLVVDALERLGTEARARFRLTVAGAPPSTHASWHARMVRRLRHLDGVALDIRHRFLATEEFRDLVRRTDCMLVPYRQHHGASGPLGSALSAGNTAVVSDFGWPGELAKKNGCATFRDGDPEDLAQTLRLVGHPDRSSTTVPWGYADEETFARTLWASVCAAADTV